MGPSPVRGQALEHTAGGDIRNVLYYLHHLAYLDTEHADLVDGYLAHLVRGRKACSIQLAFVDKN